MNLDEIDAYCQSLPGVTVRYPFETAPDLRAWCIGKRMFAWCATAQVPLAVQLKADPDLIPTLIENYTWVQPGYHMNKRHWITVLVAQTDTTILTGLLEDAHALIAASLPKAERVRLLGD